MLENYIRIGHTATGEYGNYVCSDFIRPLGHIVLMRLMCPI